MSEILGDLTCESCGKVGESSADDRRSGDAEATAKSLESMVEGCEVVDFPQVRHDFSDTKIYWRKGAESKAADQQPPPLDTREASEPAQV
jgi:hypothetical protein